MTLELPPGLLAARDDDASWTSWLDTLPRLAAEVLAAWDLTPEGTASRRDSAVVVPVRPPGGRAAVLKLTWPHAEARHEHLALQHWHGDGAVELLRADPRRWAMLLERASEADRTGGPDLTTVPDVVACEVVGTLYRRLHRPAVPQLPRLSDLVAGWSERLAALPRDAPLPRRLVEQAVTLGQAFATDGACDGTLLHGDLHYANVLSAEREPWLVTDPRPVSGDPHHEVAPLLWHRWDEVVGSGDVRWAVRRRLHAAVGTAGLSAERTRDWAVVRAMHDALRTVETAARQDRHLTHHDRERVTRAVTIVKAVQD